MTIRRRGAAAIAAGLAAALVLGGCAVIPRSGDVQAGPPQESTPTDPQVDFLAEAPSDGASRVEILRGFVEAASSTRDNFGVAREYLTPEFAADWRPDENVTIDRSAERAVDELGDDGLTMTVTPIADVNERGVYRELTSQEPIAQQFRFARVGDQWRIAQAPDGIVLDQSSFPEIFSAHAITFFDPTWTYLVPELRWYPSRSSTGTRVLSALLDGPSEWLRPAVVSAFPESTLLTADTVTVSEETATVDLTMDQAAVTDEVIGRIQAQISQTLGDIPTIGDISLRVNGSDIDQPAAEVGSTRVDARPLVKRGDEVGFLAERTVSSIGRLAADIDAADPDSLVVGADRTAAVMGTESGSVLVRDGEVAVADARPDQAPPALDTRGFVWTVPRADPGDISVLGPDGESRALAVAWPEARRIESIDVSRDGTRLLAQVADGSGDARLVVAGVERAQDGAPIAVGEPVALASGTGAPIDATWVDDRTVAALTSGPDGDGETTIQPIGGASTRVPSYPGAAAIVGGNSMSQLRVLTESGELAERQQAGWQLRASGVDVLATQLGSPD